MSNTFEGTENRLFSLSLPVRYREIQQTRTTNSGNELTVRRHQNNIKLYRLWSAWCGSIQ